MIKTKIVKLKVKNPDNEKLKDLAKIISSGGIVAFPTETVYGIGANALDEKAVEKIFHAKGRPSDNPLIVHISEIKEAKKLVKHIPTSAKLLAEKFWPGPLTIILKKNKIVPDIITAGLDTVALRVPDNKIALELIKLSNCPISAPSANKSGKPSPTNAKHVYTDLNGKIDAIIDGGKTKVGIESTVIDLTGETPTILRPGIISKKQISKFIKGVKLAIDKETSSGKILSPGTKYKHYSPKAKIILIRSKDFKKEIEKIIKTNDKLAVLTTHRESKYSCNFFFIGNTPKMVAKNLFNFYRKLDELRIKTIIIEAPENSEKWLAVNNRLNKSAWKIIE